VRSIITTSALLLVVVSANAAAPRAPRNVKAERQDFQAARITWDPMGNGVRYQLYASYDQEPLDFYQEHNGQPIAENFAIWDAPRKGKRQFVFYVTAVNKKGQESAPSKKVKVDLGELPR
jgi:hypothetical protein